MFESLFAKTFAVLGVQLCLTLVGALSVIALLRYLHRRGVSWISGSLNEDGQLDLELDYDFIRPWWWAGVIINFGIFFVMYFLHQGNPGWAFALYTLWSLLMGAHMALTLVRVDENLGARVLMLTMAVTLICGIIGTLTTVDLMQFEGVLLIALFALLALTIVRIFVRLGDRARRISAAFGILVFVGYLLMDFYRLASAARTGENSWSSAIYLSLELYLDIVNLFLQLLDLMW